MTNTENLDRDNNLSNETISPWRLLTTIKPILADELVANLRFDRSGIRIAFLNGQKFHLTITEIK